MIAAILSLLGSSFFGSLIGGVFAWLNRKADMQVKVLELEHETKRWTHDLAVKDKDLEYAKIEAQGKKEVAIVEADGAIESARMMAIAAAQAADKVSAEEIQSAGKLGWVFVLASAFNKLIRPGATVLLTSAALILNGILILRLVDAWPNMSPDRQFEMGMQAFAWVTGQAAAALGYWFVSRGSSK